MAFSDLNLLEKIGICFLMGGCFGGFLVGTLLPSLGVNHFFLFAHPELHTQYLGFGLMGSMALAMVVITFLGIKKVKKDTKKDWFFMLAVARTCIAFGFTVTYLKQGDGLYAAIIQWGLAGMLFLFHVLAPSKRVE